jgi:hypothetical protein
MLSTVYRGAQTSKQPSTAIIAGKSRTDENANKFEHSLTPEGGPEVAALARLTERLLASRDVVH